MGQLDRPSAGVRGATSSGRWRRCAAGALVVALVTVAAAFLAPVPVDSATPAALPPCTNPPPSGSSNFTPQALRERGMLGVHREQTFGLALDEVEHELAADHEALLVR